MHLSNVLSPDLTPSIIFHSQALLIWAMAAIMLLRSPPSLRPPVVVGAPGSIISWNNSHGTRRQPPSVISMSSQSHHQAKTTKQAFSGLRAVHTPAPTPILGNFSRSSRGAKKNDAGYIPRAATLDCFTSRELVQNAVALAHSAFRGCSEVKRALASSPKQVSTILFSELWAFSWVQRTKYGARLARVNSHRHPTESTSTTHLLLPLGAYIQRGKIYIYTYVFGDF
jgi:hypothetical protein